MTPRKVYADAQNYNLSLKILDFRKILKIHKQKMLIRNFFFQRRENSERLTSY